MATDIKQLLPTDVRDALLGALNPSAANVYLTVSTVSNGLTATATTLKLGGALTANTNITGAFTLSLGTSASRLSNLTGYATTLVSLYAGSSGSPGTYGTLFAYGASNNYITGFQVTDGVDIVSVEATKTTFQVILTAANSIISINNAGATIVNNGVNNAYVVNDALSKGIVYAADYTANFTPESLVTQRWVQNSVGTMTLSTMLVSPSIYGSTAASGTLLIDSTTNNTKGPITFGAATRGNSYLFNVGTSTSLISFMGRVGATTNAAIYLAVASGSESNTNYALSWDGSLRINAQSTTSAINLLHGNTATLTITPGNSVANSFYALTPRARTTLTTTSNIPTFDVLTSTQSWAAGTVPLQYFNYFRAQTMAFASASSATFVASGVFEMPINGSNATLVTVAGIHVPTYAYTGTVPTTAYSAYFIAPTGATNNYALGLSGTLITNSRILENQGADVASANNLVLGSDGNTFEITGTTQINLISNIAWQNGATVTLLFTSTPTVKHNQATSTTNITIQLAGAVDFAATAGDTLTLRLCEIGGTQTWREIARAVI